MFIRVYPFLYFLYGLRVQPLLKKKHDRHHTKQNGVVINVVIFLQSFGFSLRVFPSGSLRVPSNVQSPEFHWILNRTLDFLVEILHENNVTSLKDAESIHLCEM
jgi:hypothetical protein